MSHCWKCGKRTQDGVIECSAHSSVKFTYSAAKEFRMVDWSKVETLEDMKRILTVMGLRVLVGSAAWKELHEFLED